MSYQLTSPITSFDDCTREFRKLMEEANRPVTKINFATTYVAPVKYTEGDTYKADGTSWNPGSGGGVYTYRAGAWRFLG